MNKGISRSGHDPHEVVVKTEELARGLPRSAQEWADVQHVYWECAVWGDQRTPVAISGTVSLAANCRPSSARRGFRSKASGQDRPLLALDDCGTASADIHDRDTVL